MPRRPGALAAGLTPGKCLYCGVVLLAGHMVTVGNQIRWACGPCWEDRS